jgi:hypothetical protein
MIHILRSIIISCLFLSFSFLVHNQAIAETICTLNGKEVPCSELKESFSTAQNDINNFLTNELKMSEADKQELKRSFFTAIVKGFLMTLGILLLQLIYTAYHLWMFIDCIIRFGKTRGLLALAIFFIPFVCIYYHFAIRNKDSSRPSSGGETQ